MTEEQALKASTGWVRGDNNLYGYFPFLAANTLVATGKYAFHQASCWGYILEKLNEPVPAPVPLTEQTVY